MTAIKLALLEYAIRALIGADWSAIRNEVEHWLSRSMEGEQKKQVVFVELRQQGCKAATWLLSAAIDIAYGLAIKRINQKQICVKKSDEQC